MSNTTNLRTNARTSRHRVTAPNVGLAVAAMVAALLPLASPGPAVAAGTDYLDETFAEQPADWTDGWYDAAIGSRNQLTRISDGAEASAVRVTIPAGAHFGSAARWRFSDHGHSDPQQLYFRYWLRFPDGYVNYGKGKLPGFGGLYSSSGRNNIKPSDANPGWSARMYFSPTAPSRNADHTRIGFYVYHRDQPESRGELRLWDTAPAELRHGSWYCVEGYVAMNTPGAADGTLTGWVDEKLAYYAEDLRFRGAGDTAMGVESFWFDTYYGGTETAPGTLSIDIDSLRLSSERIGCGGRSPGSFGDTGGSVHRADIAKLAHAGITRGCNPPDNDLFCPTSNVTRGQMAAFLVRALALPASPIDHFTDDDESVFETNIDALAAAGITAGCNPPANDRYCPDRSVTRGQMAAFLDRALGLAPTATDHFTDDDETVFETNIDRLAAAGITAGCNPPANDRYCPDNSVTREQMASFLARALGLASPPPVPDGPTPVAIPPGFDDVVPAGASIQATIDSQPPGAAILLESGVHPRQEVEPKPGQSLVGEPGTVLDGEFESAQAIFSKGAGAVDNVTITGVAVTGYDPPHNQGAIHAEGSGWVVEDCEVHHTENAGIVVGDFGTIRNCNIHHNRQTGIYLNGVTGVVIEGNEISYSNDLDDHMHIGAGGTEFWATTDLVVRSNDVHDNHGHGLWGAADNMNTTYAANTVHENYRAGIFHAQSYDAVIRDNTITGNGTVPGSATDPVKDAGILIAGPDAEVYGNTVEDNFNGITFFNEAPRTGLHGSTAIRYGYVHDNVVTESGYSGARSGGDGLVLSTTSYESNTYRYTDTAGTWWYWDGYKTWAAWQGLGNDTTGTLGPP